MQANNNYNKRMKYWTLIFLFFFSTILFGQNKDYALNSKTQNPELIKKEITSTKNSLMSELDYYKSLYESTKER